MTTIGERERAGRGAGREGDKLGTVDESLPLRHALPPFRPPPAPPSFPSSLCPSLFLPLGLSGQYCLEARGNAVFSDGACDGKRTTQEQVLALPMGDPSVLQPVRLVAGIASNEFAPVVITKPFLLRGRGGRRARGREGGRAKGVVGQGGDWLPGREGEKEARAASPDF